LLQPGEGEERGLKNRSEGKRANTKDREAVSRAKRLMQRKKLVEGFMEFLRNLDRKGQTGKLAKERFMEVKGGSHQGSSSAVCSR